MTGAPEIFRKVRPGAPSEYFVRESEGLQWLAEVSDGAPVVEVLSVSPDWLDLQKLPDASPTEQGAWRFGEALARTHDAGAEHYGQSPPSTLPTDSGFIADLPLPYGTWSGFGHFYAHARLLPYVELLDQRSPSPVSAEPVFSTLISRLEREDPHLVGPPEAPCRIHGDLWAGNVVWSDLRGQGVEGWLIDPAAHGGHRETDLAMLALFGAPYLEAILAGYQSQRTLSPGWRDRVPLHQVHPLLVHAVLFGGTYLEAARTAARAALAGC